jgi:hypothetical protein
MTTVRDRLPEGRYGRVDAARTDRRLKLLGSVLGGVLLVFVGWAAWWYLSTNEVSGQVITFKVVSNSEVQAHLEVDKPAGTTAVCTLRSQAPDQSEVGRKEVALAQHTSVVDTRVAIRTTARGTTAELLGCQPASQSR